MPSTTTLTLKPDTRDALLDAADALVAEQGAPALTLDAVAARAKVSKGGLLYHFKSKEALMTAMIDRFIASAEAEFGSGGLGRQPQTAGEALTAYVESGFVEPEPSDHAAMGILAAIGNQPELLEPVRAFFARRAARLVDLERPGEALAVMLAVDGYFLLKLLGCEPIPKPLLSAVQDALTDWAERAAKPHPKTRG